jgi:hypothetical protein
MASTALVEQQDAMITWPMASVSKSLKFPIIRSVPHLQTRFNFSVATLKEYCDFAVAYNTVHMQ